MKTKLSGVCLLAFLFSAVIAVAQVESTAPVKWAKEMADFEAADRATPPVPGGIVFVGSSSIRMWSTLAQDFPGAAVVNRGFGGSEIRDCIVNFDRLIGVHRPRLVVLYSGSNDIWGGRSPEDVAADFREFCAKVHAELPETRVVFGSIVLTPARWAVREKFAVANAYIAAFCSADPRRGYLDINPAMLDAEGNPRVELYLADRQHLNAAGYVVWRNVFKSLIP